jgi:hypothetical protein
MTDHAEHRRPGRTDPKAPFSRRRFLQMAGLAAAGALAACAEAGRTDEFGPQAYATATEVAVLESPQAPEATAPPLPAGLEQFLKVSAAITGVSPLDPRVGALYLQALDRNAEVPALTTLYDEAGLNEAEESAVLERLRASGVLDREPTRNLVREIARLWYTGTYPDGEGEMQVATYVDSLAWKTLRFTKPASTCGSFGFWERAPDVDVSGTAT